MIQIQLKKTIFILFLKIIAAIGLSLIIFLPSKYFFLKYNLAEKALATVIAPHYLNFESEQNKKQNQAYIDKMVLLTREAINQEGQTQIDSLNYLQELLLDYVPKYTLFQQGDKITEKGDYVTSHQKEALGFLSKFNPKLASVKFIGVLIFIGVIFLSYRGILAKFLPRQHKKFNRYVLAYLVTLLLCFATWILQVSQHQLTIFNLLFLIPIPFAALIFTLLVNALYAFIGCMCITMIVGIMIQANSAFLAILLGLSAFVVMVTHRKNKRKEVMKVGYLTSLFLGIVVISYGLITLETYYLWYLANGLFALINGVGSAMISLALLPYFESLFAISTNQTLLELADLNHPLLKRMMINAPGTYQHSIMVANLAETAAEEINANPVLCRAGGYFHDIGKMKRPLFYVENQKGDNPHHDLSPRMSKTIIAAHTKEGVELAKQYKLPSIVIEFIQEHHGTSLVSFFYIQAKQKDNRSNPEEDFRYPGPKPHFKESGILLLADAVEAAVRALVKPTLPKIENVVNEIFNDKIKDGQLDDCPLTIKEIACIKNSFMHVLKGIHHKRLDYQSEIDSLIKQDKNATPST